MKMLQSYKELKIPNSNPFLSRSAKHDLESSTVIVEDCTDPAQCSKLLRSV